MLLVGRNEKGSSEELIAHADNDTEMYQWLAGVRRTMDSYAEHGAFMPAGGAADPAMAAMDSQYDAALAAAIAASMAETDSAGAGVGAPAVSMGMGGPSAEDEMAIALAMSMEDQGGAGAAALVSSAPPPAVRVAQVRCNEVAEHSVSVDADGSDIVRSAPLLMAHRLRRWRRWILESWRMKV